MARTTSSPTGIRRPRWLRRLRRLAVLGAVVGAAAFGREQVLRRDQQRFDAKYGSGS